MKRKPIVIHNTPITPAPWEFYQWGGPDAEARDLWMVRISLGLVIGPIFGKKNAQLIAAAPVLYQAAREHIFGDEHECGTSDSMQRVIDLHRAALDQMGEL